MTEQEYKTIIAEQDAEIRILKVKMDNAEHKKSEATASFCESLTKQYAKFIAKKVKITFTVMNYLNEPTDKECIGFLQGFKKMRYDQEICPIIAKIKKDGSISRNNYSEWQIKSYKHITKIELVE